MQVIQEISEIQDINNWFIVDMGYSNNTKSCGVMIVRDGQYTDNDLEDISFAKLEKKFQGFYDEYKNRKIGLILEAPLSIAFDKNKEGHYGNPLGRKDLEKEGGITRYWYYGAGATVTLGALEFINRIKKTLVCNDIYLFEGFVSFKGNKNEEKKKDKHYKDAKLLYCAIKDKNLCEKKINLENDEQYMFIGDYLNLKINGIPPIVKISKENKKEIFMIKS